MLPYLMSEPNLLTWSLKVRVHINTINEKNLR